jgi:hypothetical protein
MSALRTCAAATAVAMAAGLAGWLGVAACLPEPSSGFVDSNDLPDGGLRVNPLVVTCGTSTTPTCDVAGGQQCCSGPGVPYHGACYDAGATCPSDTAAVLCNETADCSPGQVCCASLFAGDGGYISAQCAASCPAPGMQLCRTNGECSGDKCVVQTCSDGLTYEMCSLSTSAAFPCTPGPAP